MNVVLIRHGRAGSPAEFARSGMGDDLRPLTVEGRKRMRRNAEGLKAIVGKLDVIVTSPLVRTVETAQIVAKAFGKVTMAELADLAPGGAREKIVRWMKDQRGDATVAIVGHEPSLSRLASWLVCGGDRQIFELKKGGACAVRLGGKIAEGAGELLWLMTPRQLRRQAS
jgi:phosphohistidine phosphatase